MVEPLLLQQLLERAVINDLAGIRDLIDVCTQANEEVPGPEPVEVLEREPLDVGSERMTSAVPSEKKTAKTAAPASAAAATRPSTIIQIPVSITTPEPVFSRPSLMTRCVSVATPMVAAAEISTSS